MVTLQNELVKQGLPARTSTPEPGEGGLNVVPRNLLSANFVPGGKSVVHAAGSFGRGFLTAGDKLRDMIVPESLASVLGGWGGSAASNGKDEAVVRDTRYRTQLRGELDELLTASCPLCDSMVRGLDKAFVNEGDHGGSWGV